MNSDERPMRHLPGCPAQSAECKCVSPDVCYLMRVGDDAKKVRLDLGAGKLSPPGFIPLGNINGTPIFPLQYADSSVDEIRASHVLEHFPHGQVVAVLKEWVRALKPGGVLKIAVPDFGKVAEGYVAGLPQLTEGYVMGGQTDAADFHKSIFDQAHLRKLLAGAGLMLIRDWQSELPDDCAALPISLNLRGTKPHLASLNVSAVMSVPRLGFQDNMFCVNLLSKLNIEVRRHTGAYWSQCIERVIEETIAEDKPDLVMTVDYDSLFSRSNASMLIQLMCCNPQADAIAAMQAGRGKDTPLFTIKGEDGNNARQVAAEEFEPDLKKVATAHFGLTVLRASAFAKLPKPWFLDAPDKNGGWGEGRIDADIGFWRKWEAAGKSLYNANRVPVGHLELGVLWPGKDLRAIWQPISDYRDKGVPKDVWQ